MKKILFLSYLFAVVGFTACKKISCFNQSLKDLFANTMCPMDCPGVMGCDG